MTLDHNAFLMRQRVAVPIAYGLLLGAALFLCFYRLDARLLWGDEAETATLARNVLHFGVPKTSDGLNETTLLTVLAGRLGP